ncbi:MULTISPECIES: nuclear transport factor 2 family protein [Spongiibacter]|jgi:hypothetical protein|uniref:nuclear transport factor 2 family protein n=1 Tax=Spongiibacter TaxID=630749 RepID=UPI000C3C3679|nr:MULTISPECIES: nuclear transport factor 2 family protein [Spongiibacter]MAY38280.1 hypothetical protein [Spongiibacter sp.]|tara:strand:+ start:10640 stop:11002 length:363 start_codon:yes stop_codon:yes gene_type:complete
MTSTDTLSTQRSTEEVVRHHLASLLDGNIDRILTDYDDCTTVFTPDGPVQGLAPLRQLFQNFLGQLPPGSLEKLEVSRQDIRGDSAYLLWRIPGLFALGTDTLVIRDGKIRLQSFAIAAN